MPTHAEANLSALIESSDDPIWSVDAEYRLLTFNHALLRTSQQNFGVTARVGMTPEDFPSAAEGEAWIRLYDQALQEGPFRTEIRVNTGRILELSLHPIMQGDRAIGVSAFSKDVTESRQAQAALEAAEKRYRDLFDGAIEGMFQTSLVDSTRTANQAVTQMLGYPTPEQFIAAMQETPEAIWVDTGQYGRFYEKLYREGAIHGYECQWKQKDGTPLWVAVSSRLVLNEEGRPVSHEGFVKNIAERKLAEMRLRDSEERFRSTFDQAAVGIVHVSFEGEILACNRRFAAILGYAQQQLVGMSVKQLTPPEHLAQSVATLALLRGDVSDYPSWEKPYIRKDGSLTWVRITASTQRDGDGNPLHHISFVEDINAERLSERALATAAQALKTSEKRYRTIFQTMLDSVVIGRAGDGMFVEVNEAFLRLTGYDRDEVIGKSAAQVNIFIDDRDARATTDLLQSEESFGNLELCFRKKSGEIFWGILSASHVDLDGVPCVLSVIRDITAAKAAEDTIHDLAFFDPLTRVANRRLLLDRLQQALTSTTRITRKMALLFVDLDNFKVLNDTLGHHTGDLLLKEVAQRLAASIRESDTVARLGGDEFGVMLGNLSGTPEDAAAQAKAVAEKIFAAVAKPYACGDRQLHAHCSVGITVFGAPHQDPGEILQQAEIAMYQGKAAGRGAIRFFSPALQSAVNQRAALEQDLRQAIRDEEFELFYQPQVDASGLIGAEVLLRWNHPRRGILAPGEFIPLAEETGLILALGMWTLQAACRQLAAWAQALHTLPFSLAVNISAREFRQTDFVDRVLGALAQSGADPVALKLELTESILVDDVEDVISKMTELRLRGLSFSLDDFGTGYSSLSYLKRLPLDQLKIDRAFVRDILSDVSSGAIAQTVVSLGKAMGLSVVAEGVETAGQRDFLTGLGCSSFQGYLFSRPLPVQEFERLWLHPKPSPVPAARRQNPSKKLGESGRFG